MKTEIYKKVYIQSEVDLPKDANWYFIFQSSRGMDVLFYTGDLENKTNWLSKVDWYLLPVELPSDEKIEKWADFCADNSVGEFDTKVIIKAALMLGARWTKEKCVIK
jgi:hypothetical protein